MASLQEGLQNITSLLDMVESNKQKSKENARVAEILNRFDSIAGLDTASFNWLPSEDRAFVLEGTITQIVKDKEKEKWKAHENFLMLFTDLLFVTNKLDKAQDKKTYIMDENGLILLCMVALEDNVDVGDAKFPADQTFKLVVETGKDTRIDMYFTCKNPVEKHYWFGQLSSKMKANRGCFGRPVEQVVQRDKSDIPRIVKGTLRTLMRKDATKLEGIFRIAGETKYLVQMKALYDRWEECKPTVNLDRFDSFDIASLLKQWFRELPEPIMTFHIYDKYMSNDDEIDYNQLLEELPPLNRKIILYVFAFCVELTKYSEQNKMTPANVAICWGPTILRPLHDDIHSSMRIPRVNKSVEDFVSWLSEHPENLPDLDLEEPHSGDPLGTPSRFVSGLLSKSLDPIERISMLFVLAGPYLGTVVGSSRRGCACRQ